MSKTVSNYFETNTNSTLCSRVLTFNTGPFNLSVQSDIPAVTNHLRDLYADYPLLDDDAFIDFHIATNRQYGLRRWIKPQVVFSLDGFEPFAALPLAQAAAQFEWGLNWCIAGQAHQYLIIHSAVVEKDGISIIMPGQPGSGKSTLCAALLFEGWRLLSDEMALISLSDNVIQPVPRPVSLKNQSIDIIRHHYPDALFGPIIKGTTKGDVSHLKPPITSVMQEKQKANITYIVFPCYKHGSETMIEEKARADAGMSLIQNAFNFNILGVQGFEAVTKVIDQAKSFEITYPDLDQALKAIDQIVNCHS